MLNTNVGFADCHIYLSLLEGQRVGNPKSIYGWRLSLEKNIRVGGNQHVEKTQDIFTSLPTKSEGLIFVTQTRTLRLAHLCEFATRENQDD